MNVKQTALILTLCSIAAFSLSGCVTAMVAAGTAGAGAIIGSDSRTIGRLMYDEQIESETGAVLSNDRLRSRGENFHVECIAFNGNLILAGETTDGEYLNWCVNYIRNNVSYLNNVYNYVQNKAPISASASAKDAYITSRVKTALLFGKDISSGRFKVMTVDGTVYLMGFVTRDEATRAINATRDIGGVQKVVHRFDYMTDVPNSSDPVQVYTDSSSGSGWDQSYYMENQATVDNGGAVLLEDSDLLSPAQIN